MPSILFANRTDRFFFAKMFRRFLSERHPDIRLFISHENRDSAMRFLDDGSSCRFVVLPKLNSAEYLGWYEEFCKSEEIGLIFTSGDRDLVHLSSIRSRLKGLGTRVICGDQKYLFQLMDKARHSSLFSGTSIAIPRTAVVGAFSNAEDYESFLGDYPYFVKPRLGQSAKDSNIVENRGELNRVTELGYDFILQKFIPGEHYTVDVLSVGGEVEPMVVVRKRVSVFEGQSYVSTTTKSAELVEVSSVIARAIDLRGPFNFQFICYIQNTLMKLWELFYIVCFS